jgi:hypothetical protein
MIVIAGVPKGPADRMTVLSDSPEPAVPTTRRKRRGPTGGQPAQGGGAVYGLGIIGALVYFVGRAETPGDYALAVGKAVMWPALLVYLALRKLDA